MPPQSAPTLSPAPVQPWRAMLERPRASLRAHQPSTGLPRVLTDLWVLPHHALPRWCPRHTERHRSPRSSCPSKAWERGYRVCARQRRGTGAPEEQLPAAATGRRANALCAVARGGRPACPTLPLSPWLSRSIAVFILCVIASPAARLIHGAGGGGRVARRDPAGARTRRPHDGRANE